MDLAKDGDWMPVLPNQTWVLSPTCSKANLLTPPDCGEGKCSVYCKVPDKESGTASTQKSPSSQLGFSKAFLKARRGGGVLGYVISSHTILCWLMVRYSKKAISFCKYFLILASLQRGCIHFFHLVEVPASAKQLRKCASGTII